MIGWRDGIATLLVTAAAVAFGAFIGAWSIPALTDPRVATLALGGIGLAACIAGSTDVTSLKGNYMGYLSALGGLAMVIFVLGAITAWTLAPALLMTDIVLMWALATTRHALMGARLALRA